MLGALGVVKAGELCVPLSTRGVQGAGPRFESQEAGVREPEGGRPAQAERGSPIICISPLLGPRGAALPSLGRAILMLSGFKHWSRPRRA